MYQDIIIKVLSNVPIFMDLPPESIAGLAGMAKFGQFNEGTIVFNEGDPGDTLYIIASGTVEIYTKTSAGEHIKLKTLEVAEVFGEMALFDGLPRSASARIIRKSILFYIHRTDFNFFLVQNPDAALKLIEGISRRLRDTNQSLMRMADENETLKAALKKTTNTTAIKVNRNTYSTGNTLRQEQYTCPYCDSAITSLKAKADCIELVKNDDDFCPYYKTVNPLYYEVVVCPQCRYAFNEKTFGRLTKQDKVFIEGKMYQGTKIGNISGVRSLDQAIEAFRQIFLIHDERKISSLIKADICLKLAWLYRYKEDRASEIKSLFAARQRFMESYENDKYSDPKQDIYIMYIIANTLQKTGDPDQSMKWLSRIMQHSHRGQYPQLVERAREQWLIIKNKTKKNA